MPAAKIPAQAEPQQLWQVVWRSGDEYYEHWRGVPWHEAVMPKPEHRCLAQTRGVVRVGGLPAMPVQRCACGAVDVGEGWEDRNSRM